MEQQKQPDGAKGLVPVALYVVAWVVVLVALFACKTNEALPAWMMKLGIALDCVATGGLAGCLYCLRAIYLNHAVYNRWDLRWGIWYALRPITSCMAGGASLIFLSAGLLALNAEPDGKSMPYGYLAAAFFAGFNVDRFLERVEEIGKTTFGIRASRSAALGEADTAKKGPDS